MHNTINYFNVLLADNSINFVVVVAAAAAAVAAAVVVLVVVKMC